jgi:hypothetical protein
VSSYSGVERNIARVLGRFPRMKQFAKLAYSRLVYLKAKKSFKYQAWVEPVVYTLNQENSFFGYYDKSPENGNGWVLAQVSKRSTKELPSKQYSIELVVFDEEQRPLLRLPMKAYNWQQGCRCHWLTDDVFIFNDFDTDKKCFVARVYSVDSKQQVKAFEQPVQDSFGVDYFISLNYQRLMTLRPDYGYRNLPNLNAQQLGDLENDGLWRVNYETGDCRLLISLADACKIKPLNDFQNAVHKFNHVIISPDGQRFIFMHRYYLGKRRFDRLLLGDARSGNIELLSDYGMVSHCFWADSNTVIGYMRGPSDKDGYWLLDVNNREFNPLLQDKLVFYGDGHPHVYGDWFVTDTYPDKARMQHLLLCNWKTGEVKEIGEFFHGFEFQGECRCDLHPRFSPDGRAVYFDSVFSHKRQLYRMELNS